MASPNPSRTPLSPEPAPLLRRTPAFLLDQVAVLLLVVPPALAVGVPFGDVVSPGLTLGKRALGLRVVADDGGTLVVRDR